MFREEAAEKLRKHTQIAIQELAARDEQLRLRGELAELELRKRTQLSRQEHLRERSEARVKSRGSGNGLAYSALRPLSQGSLASPGARSGAGG